jgi:futalosine hydrolase
MRILVVAATAMEVAPIVRGLGAAGPRDRTSGYVHKSRDIDVLVTGVGMIAASAWTSRALSERTYDLALNAGICGSFDSALLPGAVVNVVTDTVAELGAEDGDGFLPLEALGLPDDGLGGPKPSCIRNRPPDNAALAGLPAVSGVTVNTVHGSERSIAQVVARFRPQVETMEGAGFMFACAIRELPFAQVRSVSNMVERRNRSAWKIPEAIGALAPVVLQILETA